MTTEPLQKVVKPAKPRPRVTYLVALDLELGVPLAERVAHYPH